MVEYRTQTTRAPSFFLIAIVAILLLLSIVFAIADMPLTKHAKTNHQDQAVNAASLAAMVTAGTCRDMQVYDCPDNATIVILCKIKNTVVGGLVLGTNLDGTQHIITGYAARPSYWRNSVSGCRYMGGAFALQ